MIPDLAVIVAFYCIWRYVTVACRTGPRAENPLVIVLAVVGVLLTVALTADIANKGFLESVATPPGLDPPGGPAYPRYPYGR